MASEPPRDNLGGRAVLRNRRLNFLATRLTVVEKSQILDILLA
jgi:hypothetical protein